MIEILIVLILLGALAAFINSRPSHFTVNRSVTINASAAEIYPHMASPRRFTEWSPFAKFDPEAKMEFFGPEEGVGAGSSWAGNKIGSGRMTVSGVTPPTQVLLDLEFYKPMRASNKGEFLIVPDGHGSRVSWSMSGPVNFVGKAMNLVVNCDKMCGDSFETGLKDLKALVEAKG